MLGLEKGPQEQTVYYCWCDKICWHLAFYWGVSIEQLSITGMDIINAPGSDSFSTPSYVNQGYPSLSLVVASFAHLDVGECLSPLSSPLQRGFFFAFLWSLCDCPFSVYENLHSSTKSFITLFILCKTQHM